MATISAARARPAPFDQIFVLLNTASPDDLCRREDQADRWRRIALPLSLPPETPPL
jgi:hypothetical protein